MANAPKKTNIFIKLILIAFVIFAIYIGNEVFFPASIPQANYQLVINKEQSIKSLSLDLEAKGIIKNRRIFLFLLRIMHDDKKVTAGLYILKEPMSIWKLIRRITNGHPDQISITLIDGWTSEAVRNYINTLPNIRHITDKMSDTELKNALKIKESSIEGIFYPSTYFIAPNQTDLEIYQQAYQTMMTRLSNLYTTRSTATHYTSPYQLLIMASLIQKETGKIDDMYLVSTVFNNRLIKGMKLQDDPAVFYGLRDRSTKKVTHSDFQIDTPYNTYLHFGLPPTPICTPSDNALKAASQPIDKPDLLFFVAVGSGKTKFSDTYHEHLNAVSKYLKKPAIKTHKIRNRK